MSVVSRSIVSCFSFEFFLPIFVMCGVGFCCDSSWYRENLFVRNCAAFSLNYLVASMRWRDHTKNLRKYHVLYLFSTSSDNFLGYTIRYFVWNMMHFCYFILLFKFIHIAYKVQQTLAITLWWLYYTTFIITFSVIFRFKNCVHYIFVFLVVSFFVQRQQWW